MRVSGENLTFPFNQGVILVILLLKLPHFFNPRTRNVYLTGEEFIPYPSNEIYSTISIISGHADEVSGENLTFPFNQGVILVILLLKFPHFSHLELKIST